MNRRFLFVIAVSIAASTAIGWYIGRISRDHHIDALLVGNAIYVKAFDRTMASSLYDKSEKAVTESLARGQVLGVFNLYRYSKNVNAYLKYKNLDQTASGMAKELLQHMNCYETDCYFERFRELYIYGDDHRYQNVGTKEYDSFRSFIESIRPEPVKKPKRS